MDEASSWFSAMARRYWRSAGVARCQRDLKNPASSCSVPISMASRASSRLTVLLEDTSQTALPPNGRYGQFFGCMGYPVCAGTMKLMGS